MKQRKTLRAEGDITRTYEFPWPPHPALWWVSDKRKGEGAFRYSAAVRAYRGQLRRAVVRQGGPWMTSKRDRVRVDMLLTYPWFKDNGAPVELAMLMITALRRIVLYWPPQVVELHITIRKRRAPQVDMTFTVLPPVPRDKETRRR